MSVAIWYLIMCVIVIAGVLFAKEPPPQDLIDSINSWMTAQNILIASGIAGICLRLDKIAKQGKGHK